MPPVYGTGGAGTHFDNNLALLFLKKKKDSDISWNSSSLQIL
jgi:hypothetical protein